jgi:hypothetical protein
MSVNYRLLDGNLSVEAPVPQKPLVDRREATIQAGRMSFVHVEIRTVLLYHYSQVVLSWKLESRLGVRSEPMPLRWLQDSLCPVAGLIPVPQIFTCYPPNIRYPSRRHFNSF